MFKSISISTLAIYPFLAYHVNAIAPMELECRYFYFIYDFSLAYLYIGVIRLTHHKWHEPIILDDFMAFFGQTPYRVPGVAHFPIFSRFCQYPGCWLWVYSGYTVRTH
jgi:hypothetical protein